MDARVPARAGATPAAPTEVASAKVAVVRDGDSYHLTVDGAPFFVKGAGLDSGDPTELAARGANAFRTWHTDMGPAGKAMLDRAQVLGLHVAMGLEMRAPRHGFDYSDAKTIAAQQENMRAAVLRYKDHPAVLVWVVGNELNLSSKDARVWDAVESATRMIHALDPNHPVLTPLAGLDPAVVAAVKARAPSLDLLGIQLYGDLAQLPEKLRAAQWTGPYLVTEFGPVGYWEASKTAWGAPLEEDSEAKANGLLARYQNVIATDTRQCLGSFVFLWGQKQERTPTWFGMFLASGEATPSVDVMEYAWRGHWPANRAPALLALQIDGHGAGDSVVLAPNATAIAHVAVSDPDSDTLSTRWAVRLESSASSGGGDHEELPATVPVGIAADPAQAGSMRFRAPRTPGAYRLFVESHDGHGHAAYGNVPFLVRADAPVAVAPVTSAPAANAATPAPAAGIAHPSVWPALHAPIAPDARLEARITALLATMTVEEKVGQLIQGDLGSVTPGDVRKYRLGSVLAGGNSDPGGKYDATPAQWRALADAYHAAALDTSGGGKPIPVLLGIDAVHGHSNVVGATLFPHNIALGATHDPDLLRQIGAAAAAEVRSTGFDWTFAPTVTVPQDDRWGRTYEGFSEDPRRVAADGAAMVEGLQGRVGSKDFLDGAHVLATSKHFIGDGGTSGGRDKGNAEVDEATLRDLHGAGHVAALQAGVQTVMASFSSWNGVRMHGNRSLLTGVLKERLGFDGFVIGDWNGHADVTGCSAVSCAAAINAGVDMLMAPDTWKGAYENTLAQARDGSITQARLDDAVRRILRVKFRLGLFDGAKPAGAAASLSVLGSAAHRAIARQAVRESLVLLKNAGGLLPIDPRKHVLVAGDGADDFSKQSGGWTLGWQGTPNKRADFPGAQTIWEGIRAATQAAGGQATLSVDGSFASAPDVAIVVYGEAPYAEFLGDIPNLAYQPGAERDLALLRKLHAAGVPVVSVFLSGRPLWVNREINASDAFVAAWLPGSEGGGVADLLFKPAKGGDARDFRGNLPFSWPKTAVQGPLNAGMVGYDPQFGLGYGLSYRVVAAQAAPTLGEVSGLRNETAIPGIYFDRGAVAAGWSLQAGDGDAPARAVTTLPSGELAAHVVIAAADHHAQEDARRLRWDGKGAARVLLHADAPLDIARESFRGDQLVITLRRGEGPVGRVDLGIGCGPGCGAQLRLDPALSPLAVGEWTRVGVPLECFRKAGADLTRVTGLLEISSSAALDLSVSRVALGSDSDHVLVCEKP